MNDPKIAKNFYLWEFMPKGVYNRFKNQATWFIDRRIIIIAQSIRDYYGPTIVNTWKSGGNKQYRGFRPRHCNIGATLSTHRRGDGLDFDIPNKKSADVIDEIIWHRENTSIQMPPFMKMITTIERGTDGWTHVDIRWTQTNDLLIIDV